MPQNSPYRRDFTSAKTLAEEELYGLYGPDYDETRWVNETLERLKTRRLSLDFSDQDEADLKRVGYILDRRKVIEKFSNPNHGPDGRFVSGFSVSSAIAKLRNQALHLPLKPGQKLGKCATKVREAIEAGGIILNDHGVPAKGFGPSLEKAGFEKSFENNDKDRNYPPDGYTPQKGDVVVIQKTSTSPDGHMAMFDGKQWVSDFVQEDREGNPDGFWPGPKYRDEEPDYVIYRHQNIK
jgi:hypothetical protein